MGLYELIFGMCFAIMGLNMNVLILEAAFIKKVGDVKMLKYTQRVELNILA